jgi:hypothetical protein
MTVALLAVVRQHILAVLRQHISQFAHHPRILLALPRSRPPHARICLGPFPLTRSTSFPSLHNHNTKPSSLKPHAPNPPLPRALFLPALPPLSQVRRRRLRSIARRRLSSIARRRLSSIARVQWLAPPYLTSLCACLSVCLSCRASGGGIRDRCFRLTTPLHN